MTCICRIHVRAFPMSFPCLLFMMGWSSVHACSAVADLPLKPRLDKEEYATAYTNHCSYVVHELHHKCVT